MRKTHDWLGNNLIKLVTTFSTLRRLSSNALSVLTVVTAMSKDTRFSQKTRTNTRKGKCTPQLSSSTQHQLQQADRLNLYSPQKNQRPLQFPIMTNSIKSYFKSNSTTKNRQLQQHITRDKYPPSPNRISYTKNRMNQTEFQENRLGVQQNSL